MDTAGSDVWHPCNRFKRHRKDLLRVPVAVFGMGLRKLDRGALAAFALLASPRSGQARMAGSCRHRPLRWGRSADACMAAETRPPGLEWDPHL